MEPLERRGWIIVIVGTVLIVAFALPDFTARYIQPSWYSLIANGVANLAMLGLLAALFRLARRSPYSAVELIGWWRRLLPLGFAMGEIGVLIIIFAYPNYPSAMSQIGAALSILGLALMILAMRKMGLVSRKYE